MGSGKRIPGGIRKSVYVFQSVHTGGFASVKLEHSHRLI